MKIPSVAKRVFKGTIFNVYQWEQELYDGSFATFEALKRPSTIQIIPTVGNKILLSYEEQPGKPLRHSFLGGRQEEGEEPLATAKRELHEEAGMVSDDWELIKTFEFDGKLDWTTYLFVARNCVKDAQPHLDPGEKIEVQSYSFDAFLDVVSSETFWGKRLSDWLFRLKEDPQKLADFKKTLLASGTT
ncbi:hypothetical protein COU89_01025 [Candidatus Roizmanbacteria bacterium CG10_big_fil_rev_8_21_14_0_10_45_7]|uniref:Nudix hydrolase domain-containing protein n=1 Tax=Candidatus Roizmanbacteria bacterium CG10_big_fil_rev_8_21_14_0_10_45_7 TaxID=1974854 RepID=A0A2M8KVB9_9BACT|nr:MAG: hypothetical protein COU89_01025 [Candidatus Roizmanbacteria bacterium CG10_big_fil_rev_8_21_14_0_10_45_7]